MLPMIIHGLIQQNTDRNHPEFRLDEFNNEIQLKLESKRQEFANLFDASQDNNPFQDEMSAQERKVKAQALLQEIAHLESTLHQFK